MSTTNQTFDDKDDSRGNDTHLEIIEDDLKYNYYQEYRDFMCLLLPIYLSTFVNNLISTIRVPFMMSVLNHVSNNNKYMISAIGTVGSFDSLGVCTIWALFFSSLTILSSRYYAKKEYYEMGIIINRTRYLGHIVTIICTIIQIFTIRVYCTSQNLSEKSADYAFQFNLIRCLDFNLAFELGIMSGYYNIIGRAFHVFLMNLSYFVTLPLFSYLFIYFIDWNVSGMALSIFLMNVVNYALNLLYAYYFNPLKNVLFMWNWDIWNFKGILHYFKVGLPFLLSALISTLGDQLTGFFTRQFKESLYAPLVITNKYTGVVGSIRSGLDGIVKIIISFPLAENKPNKAKRYVVYFIINSIFITYIYILINFTIGSSIMELMVNAGSFSFFSKSVNWMYLSTISSLFDTLPILFAAYITIGYFWTGMAVSSVNIGISLLFSYIFMFPLNLKIMGSIVGPYAANIFVIAAYIVIYCFFIDWEGCAKEIYLEHEELFKKNKKLLEEDPENPELEKLNDHGK